MHSSIIWNWIEIDLGYMGVVFLKQNLVDKFEVVSKVFKGFYAAKNKLRNQK